MASMPAVAGPAVKLTLRVGFLAVQALTWSLRWAWRSSPLGPPQNSSVTGPALLLPPPRAARTPSPPTTTAPPRMRVLRESAILLLTYRLLLRGYYVAT